MPTELLALLVTDAELRSWSLDDARRALAWRKAEVVRLPLVSSLASALETIGIQLEGGRGGSRFPGIWNLAVPLVEDEVSGWFLGFLDHVLADIATIEREFETLSIGRAATVWLGDEGFPEIYGRESPGLEARYGGEGRGRNLRAWFAATIDEVKALCADAKGAGKAVVLVREGVRVTYLWNFAPRTSPGDGLR